jgi:ribosomal protein S18 acetylase RimI-like enzyme
MIENLRFETINLALDADVCIAHRRDAYVCTHGHSNGFYKQLGGETGERYLGRLQSKIEAIPEGNCLVYWSGELVGQIEVKWHQQPEVGYVNLFYVRPEFRRQGVGEYLHRRVVDLFEARGANRLLLSVGQGNERARAFYQKLGWESMGPHPEKPYAEYYQYELMHD